MKKDSEEKNILKHQKRRRNKKIRLGVSSVLLIIIAIILILIYLKLGKNEYNTYSEEAKVEYKVELKDNDWNNWYFLGTAYSLNDNYEEAVKCFKKVKELNPNSEDFYK